MRILNVGCGTDTYGTDFCDAYPSRPEVVTWNAPEQLPFEDKTFDEVYSRNILEHVPDPGTLIKDMARVLKPGGKFVLISDSAFYFLLPISGAHTGGYERAATAHGRPNDRHYMVFAPIHLHNFAAFAHLKVDKIDFLPTRSTNIDLPDFSPKRGMVRATEKILHVVFPNVAYPFIRLTARKIA